MANLTFEDLSIGMRFKSLIPIELGDGIEFSEGSSFRVTEVVFNGAYEDEQRFMVTLQCTEAGHHWMTLPVETPKDRERSGYLRELGVPLALLNQQFEKLDEDE